MKIHKRVTHIAIKQMQAPEVIVDGKKVKICLNGCGTLVPEGNKKYCSLKCANEFYAKHNQKGLREYLRKREHAKCQRCGWKNPKRPRLPAYPKRPGWVEGGIKAHRLAMQQYEKDYEEISTKRKMILREWRKTSPKPRAFVADHIIPIAIGGDEFDLKNVQWLCAPCNKEKTKHDQATIALYRRRIKLIGTGGQPLTQFNSIDKK